MSLYSFQSDRTLSRLARLEDAVPLLIGGGKYAGNRYATLSSVSTSAVSGGLIDLSSTGLITIGAIPPTVSEAGFALTWTDTTATVFYDGTNSSQVIVIRRTDQSRFTIPPSSRSITGLTASTWYGLLPYWAPYSKCNISWVQGTVGTPQICFPGGTGASFVNAQTPAQQADSIAQQLFQGREQLSAGFLTFKTAAGGGSGSGTPTSDYNPTCIMQGTSVETLQGLPHSSNFHPQTQWWHLVTNRGKSLYCTPNHSLYHPEKGKVRADSLKDWVMTDFGEEKIVTSEPHIRCCVKEEVVMPEGHLYYANGFLSHNMKA